MADKPSKQYVIDAVDALSAFVKVQRRKIAAAKQKRNSAVRQWPTVPIAGPATQTTTGGHFNTAAGGAPDDNNRADTPPPPLEPVTPAAAPTPLFTFYTGHVAGPPQAGPVAGPATGPPGPLFESVLGEMEDVD